MKELEEYRAQIDALDVELMDILGRRFGIIRAVGRLKAEKNIEVVQSKRAEQVIHRAVERAIHCGVDGELIRRFYTDMIDVAHVIENKIREDYDSTQ